MQNKSPILLATILLGLLAIGGVAFMFMQPSAPPPQQLAVVPTPTPVPSAIYVANRDIPPRATVTQAMLRRTLISGPVPPDALQNLDEIRWQITKEPILSGETVTLASFGPRLRRKLPANFEIPSGYRAVAVWVDSTQTAAGIVDVGDRVDVVATHSLKIDKAPQQYVVGALEFTSGRMIGQNLRVLAVDESIKAPPPTPTPVPGAPGVDPAAGPPPAPTPAPQAPGAQQAGGLNANKTRVFLAATPDVATRLIAANAQGTLNIIIRNPEDADANPVPEAKEYPSTTFFRKEDNGSGNSGGGGGGNRVMPDLPPPIVPQPVMPTTPEVPTTIEPATPTAPEDNSKEITVIRGTEKTRVLVPQR